MNGDRVLDCVAQSPKLILDAGCGPHGSIWWSAVKPQSRVIAIDLYQRPAVLPPNVEFHKMNVMAAGARRDWRRQFDLIVADHLLEHLRDPPAAAAIFAQLLAPTGELHVGFPDASLFTDRFYRLIHAGGGGHVSRLTKDGVIAMMAAVGLEPTLVEPWEDIWTWLTDAFDFEARGIQLTSKDDIEYIANVFRRELTAEKGYLYGWEIIFRRSSSTAEPQGSGLSAPTATEGWRSRVRPETVCGRRWQRFIDEYARGTPERRSRFVRDLKRLVGRWLGGVRRRD